MVLTDLQRKRGARTAVTGCARNQAANSRINGVMNDDELCGD